MNEDQRSKCIRGPGQEEFGEEQIVYAAVLLLATFLAGYVPGYIRERQYEKELRGARQENSIYEMRDLASLAWLQAMQKDYGLAAATSTRFFNRTRELANQTSSEHDKKALQNILSLRDSTSAKLARGDSGVVTDLQALVVKTREIAVTPSDSQQ